MNKILYLLRWSNMHKGLFCDVVQLLPLEEDKRIYILIEWAIAGLQWHLLENLVNAYILTFKYPRKQPQQNNIRWINNFGNRVVSRVNNIKV